MLPLMDLDLTKPRKKVVKTKKSVVLGPMARAAQRRPANYNELSGSRQWAIDKELGILDWDGNPSN